MLITCAKCGWRVIDSALTCPRCSAKLATPEERQARERLEEARRIAPDLTEEQRQRMVEEEGVRLQEERLRQYLRERSGSGGVAPYEERVRPAYSYGQPLWQLAALSVATFNLYHVYWFYVTWKRVREHTGLHFSAGWRTVGLFVPIWGLVLTWRLVEQVNGLRGAFGLARMLEPGLVVGLYLLGNLAWKLPDPYWLIALLSVGPLLVVQAALNGLWRAAQPGTVLRSRPSAWEVVVLCLGGVLVALVVIGLFVPE